MKFGKHRSRVSVSGWPPVAPEPGSTRVLPAAPAAGSVGWATRLPAASTFLEDLMLPMSCVPGGGLRAPALGGPVVPLASDPSLEAPSRTPRFGGTTCGGGLDWNLGGGGDHRGFFQGSLSPEMDKREK